MPKARADIANTAVRIFLQEMGKEYDRERDLEPFAKKHLKAEVLDFFDGRCCYCGIELTPARVHGDHLIPTNRKDLGLDAQVKMRANVVVNDFMSAPQIGTLQQ